MGLDGFRQKSPTAEEVPELALHLSVAERLVRRLMEARQIKEQYPTICEFRSLAGPGSVQEKVPQEKPPAAPIPGFGRDYHAESGGFRRKQTDSPRERFLPSRFIRSKLSRVCDELG